jgi:hypothetical protein
MFQKVYLCLTRAEIDRGRVDLGNRWPVSGRVLAHGNKTQRIALATDFDASGKTDRLAAGGLLG